MRNPDDKSGEMKTDQKPHHHLVRAILGRGSCVDGLAAVFSMGHE